MTFEPVRMPHTSKFALLLLQKLHHQNQLGQNVVVSPMVVISGGMMALTGAAGDTRTELLSALFDEHISSDQMVDDHLLEFGKLFNINLKANKDILSVANMAYLRQDIPLSMDYVAKLRQHLKIEAKNLDFSAIQKKIPCLKGKFAPENSSPLDTINEDIKKTLTLSPDEHQFVVNFNIDPTRDCLILLSVIIFRAQWETAFYEWRTKLEDFHLDNGQVVKVAMMNGHNPLPYYIDEPSGTTAVSLAYRTRFDHSLSCRVDISLVLILPGQIGQMDSFLRQFNGSKLDEILDELNSVNNICHYQVQLKLPRFQVRGDHSLESALPKLDMADAFDRESANLSKVTLPSHNGPRVFISKMRQYVSFGVDEKGSFASTAARPKVHPASAAPRSGVEVSFEANRPFVYVLVANSQPRQILFIGVINKLPE